MLFSYLTERHFAVKVEIKLSEIKCIEAGVPQGWSLVPLLFNTYMPGLP